jgi:hypothetical protein
VIRRLLRWLFGPGDQRQAPLAARVGDLELAAELLDKKLEYLNSELKSVRGRVYAMKRGAQDAPESTIEQEEASEPAPRAVASTAYLSRRLRPW